MVPDTRDVERVLFGENGVADALRAGQSVVAFHEICRRTSTRHLIRFRSTLLLSFTFLFSFD
jgi:2-hydroxy-3-oxopropionate reductase